MEELLHYFGPPFLVAVGFMDPGNWATIVEGGSLFGYELVWVVFFSTLLSLLLQTISARLGLATGKHFAQVCGEELPRGVCLFLWLICEISVVTLDLTMVLGTALGLNVVLQIPVLSSLSLMVIDSLLSILVLPLLDRKRAEVIAVVVVGMVLLFFLLDALFSTTWPPTIIAGFSPKLRHETLYTTISIVGANVMPHNFYLHSALVKDQGQGHQSLSTLFHYNFVGNLFAFSAVLVVNVAVLIVAVAGFHNAGLVVLTLQDVQALIEQVLNNSISPAVFGLALLCAGQLSTMNGSTAGEIVSKTVFDCKVRPWQHRIWIRGIALLLAAICFWRHGNEGTYQMLMFSQVFLALHLPFAIAPLIKLTSSERIMGSSKNSFYFETLTWLSLVILTAVNVTLVFDLVFGESEDGPSFGGLEYLSGFEWLVENGGENLQTVVFGAISMGTSLSLGFLVWLIFTPLQLDTLVVEGQSVPRPSWIENYARQEKADSALQTLGTRPTTFETGVTSWPSGSSGESIESGRFFQDDLALITASPRGKEKVQSDIVSQEDAHGTFSLPDKKESEEANLKECDEGTVESLLEPRQIEGISHLPDPNIREEEVILPNSTTAPKSPSRMGPLACSQEPTIVPSMFLDPVTVENEQRRENGETIAMKIAEAEADAEIELLGKDDDEMDVWGTSEQEDVPSEALANNGDSSIFIQREGPEAARSDLVGFECDGGSGSLSRLSGLGRAARRQFAQILEEFWSGLFDLHGQPLPPRSHGFLSGLSGYVVDHNQHESYNSQEGTNSQKMQTKVPKSSWKKPKSMSEQVHNMEAYMRGAHAAATSWSHLTQARSQSQDFENSPSHVSERRYSSLRTPSHHEEYDYQPATIHGYSTPSFPGRIGSAVANLKSRPMHLRLPNFRSTASLSQSQHMDVDSILFQEYPNEFESSGQQALRSQWSRSVVGSKNVIETEGGDFQLTQTEKHLGPSEASSRDARQWDPLVYGSSNSPLGRWSPLAYRATGELDMKNVSNSEDQSHSRVPFGHSPIGRGGQGDHGSERAPLVFDEISPSQSHRDGFSIQSPIPGRETHSLWSRQPFEQLFGAADSEPLATQRSRQISGSQSQQSTCSRTSASDGLGIEQEILENLLLCVGKLLRLDGANWLFRLDNGSDEDLIGAIAAVQRKCAEPETSDALKSSGNLEYHSGEHQSKSQVRSGSSDITPCRTVNVHVHRCGKGCLWDGSLLVSFGVWCVHRVLELSLMESRPELWGKYTYVLNRLQGILDAAFAKPRVVPSLCSCINFPNLPDGGKRPSSSSRPGSLQDHGSGEFGGSCYQSYPHPWPWGQNTSCVKGKAANASTFLDMIKEVEIAVASRKGRTGTAAGDVAFPKGKENLASVLKRYKRRLSSKLSGSTGVSSGGRKV